MTNMYFEFDTSKKSNYFDWFTFPAGEVNINLNPSFTEMFLSAFQYGPVTIDMTAKIRSALDLMIFNALVHTITKEYSKDTTPLWNGEDNLSFNFYFPYLPYSRADRQFVDGGIIGKEFFLEQLQKSMTVPFSVKTLDMHSNKSNVINVTNVNPVKYITIAISHATPNAQILFPDTGASIRYGSMIRNATASNIGTRFDLSYHFATKVRDVTTGKITDTELPVMNPTIPIMIIDDICDGGATFIALAKKIKEVYPTVDIYLYVTHGIFSKGLDELKKYFVRVYTTNSFYIDSGDEFVHIVS